MAVTLEKLKNAVIVKLGEQADDGMLENLVDTINAGLQEMATEVDWPWLIRSDTFDTVVDQVDYDTPANCTRVRSLNIRNALLSPKQYEELIDWDGIRDEPRYYMVENNTITLAPKPANVQTVTIKYVVAEAELAADSDECFVPDWYLDLAATFCVIKEAERRRDATLTKMYEVARDRWVQKVRDNTIRTKDVPYIRTRPDWVQ